MPSQYHVDGGAINTQALAVEMPSTQTPQSRVADYAHLNQPWQAVPLPPLVFSQQTGSFIPDHVSPLQRRHLSDTPVRSMMGYDFSEAGTGAQMMQWNE